MMGESHVKKVLCLMSFVAILIVSACGNNGENGNNLIDHDNIVTGSWINYDGKETDDDEMRMTETISYNPEADYEVNRSSYVSYYNGDEFIDTVLYGEEPPMSLEKVEEADTIRISFNAYNEDDISLTEVN
jgi:hypothetical protein